MKKRKREDFLPRLDLHHKGVEEVSGLVEEFLFHCLQEGKRKVNVIHGIGSGSLRRELRKILSSHPLVSSFSPAERWRGGDGATEILLFPMLEE